MISANGGDGVHVLGPNSSRNRLEGNDIGVMPGLNPFLGRNPGNRGDGARIEGSFGNAIGGLAAGMTNTITGNDGSGIAVESGTANAILTNRIWSNGGLGIDLNADGTINPNDLGDTDSGANNLQNHPILWTASCDGIFTRSKGTLSARPDTLYTVQFFTNAPGSTTGGSVEGQMPLGTITVRTSAQGDASFEGRFPFPTPDGFLLTATVTSPEGDTSEFSGPIAVGSGSAVQPMIVTNTADNGIGSLRQAILDANAAPGTNPILFAIPDGGAPTIILQSPLPTITDTVLINGALRSGVLTSSLTFPVPTTFATMMLNAASARRPVR